jgi:hypothetical protein
MPDVVDLIEKDHRAVEQLFDDFESTEMLPKARQQISADELTDLGAKFGKAKEAAG